MERCPKVIKTIDKKTDTNHSKNKKNEEEDRYSTSLSIFFCYFTNPRITRGKTLVIQTLIKYISPFSEDRCLIFLSSGSIERKISFLPQ